MQRFAYRVTLMLLIAASFLTAACDPLDTVYYENRMERSVEVHIEGKVLETLAPGETTTEGYSNLKSAWPARVRAYNRAGDLVFDHTYTLEELEALDFRIVIQ